MNVLPDLGVLKVHETYEFYDEPVLFSARNNRGQNYLGLLAEDSDARKVWLYAPLSPQRYFEIRSGLVDLKTAFVRAEEGFVYRATIDKTTLKPVIDGQWVESQLLDDDVLPLAGEALSSVSERDVLRMAFGFSECGRYSAPVGPLGNILGSVQETVNAIGQSMIGIPTERGAVPAKILERVQLVLTETYAASFGVELQPVVQPDLFGLSDASNVLKEFFSLLSDTNTPDLLIGRTKQLQLRTAKKYRDLLGHLVDRVEYMSAQLSSPFLDKVENVRIEKSEFQAALTALSQTIEEPEPIEFTIEASLIGCNIRTKSFELRDVHEGKNYTGKIDEAVLSEGPPVIGRKYAARLMLSEKLVATGSVEVQTRLLSLQNMD